MPRGGGSCRSDSTIAGADGAPVPDSPSRATAGPPAARNALRIRAGSGTGRRGGPNSLKTYGRAFNRPIRAWSASSIMRWR